MRSDITCASASLCVTSTAVWPAALNLAHPTVGVRRCCRRGFENGRRARRRGFGRRARASTMRCSRPSWCGWRSPASGGRPRRHLGRPLALRIVRLVAQPESDIWAAFRCGQRAYSWNIMPTGASGAAGTPRAGNGVAELDAAGGLFGSASDRPQRSGVPAAAKGRAGSRCRPASSDGEKSSTAMCGHAMAFVAERRLDGKCRAIKANLVLHCGAAPSERPSGGS
jgi:hypothetical protein